MKIHKYACGECPTSPFFTTFEPKFDPPAYCPTCGSDELVTYLGEMKVQEEEKTDDDAPFHGEDQSQGMASDDGGTTP